MPFVNVSVQTKKQVFETGTVGGNWLFWVTDIKGDTIEGPQQTPNTNVIFFIAESVTKDQVFTAYAQRLDEDENPIGPQAEEQFTVEGFTQVLIDVAGGVSVDDVPVVTPTPTAAKY